MADKRLRSIVPVVIAIVAVVAVAFVGSIMTSSPAASPAPTAIANGGTPTPAGPTPSTGGPTAPSDAPSGAPASGSPATTPAATSVAPHGAHWIAAVDANGTLTTTDDQGGSVVAYAVPDETFGYPAWSPDGSRIAAVGYGSSATSIYVFTVRHDPAAKASDPVVIYQSVDSPPFYLYWTPDGSTVTFLATETTGISLRLAPADGSAPLDGSGADAVIRRGAPLYYDWAGDSRLLLHVGTGAGSFTGEIGRDGASAAPELSGTGEFRSPSVSRDGRYVAYVRAASDSSADDPTGTLVLASRDGATHQDMPVFGPAAFEFDPTGDNLATIGADKPISSAVAFPIGPLRVLDAGKDSARTLLGGGVIGFFWSPDGRTIATISLVADGPTADSGLAPARAELTRMNIAAAPALSGAPLATPQPGANVGLAFLDVPTGTVRSQRIVRLADHFVSELLPYFDQYALSHRIWSPDGTSIVLPLVDSAGRTRVDVVPADGTDLRPIADGIGAFWSP